MEDTMNFELVSIKALVVLAILFLLSFANAITFATFTGSIADGTGAGVTSLFFLIVSMLILSVIGSLLGKGIRSIKKPLEALVLTFVGSFCMGAALAIFTVLNIPFTVHPNLNWLGTNWYSPFLALLLIGAPLMLVFLVTE
jgi:hypothetical protein